MMDQTHPTRTCDGMGKRARSKHWCAGAAAAARHAWLPCCSAIPHPGLRTGGRGIDLNANRARCGERGRRAVYLGSEMRGATMDWNWADRHSDGVVCRTTASCTRASIEVCLWAPPKLPDSSGDRAKMRGDRRRTSSSGRRPVAGAAMYQPDGLEGHAARLNSRRVVAVVACRRKRRGHDGLRMAKHEKWSVARWSVAASFRVSHRAHPDVRSLSFLLAICVRKLACTHVCAVRAWATASRTAAQDCATKIALTAHQASHWNRARSLLYLNRFESVSRDGQCRTCTIGSHR